MYSASVHSLLNHLRCTVGIGEIMTENDDAIVIGRTTIEDIEIVTVTKNAIANVVVTTMMRSVKLRIRIYVCK